MSAADQAERVALALLQTLALTDTDAAERAFTNLLRSELAMAFQKGFRAGRRGRRGRREGLREASMAPALPIKLRI
jgi:hypothetical protein